MKKKTILSKIHVSDISLDCIIIELFLEHSLNKMDHLVSEKPVSKKGLKTNKMKKKKEHTIF